MDNTCKKSCACARGYGGRHASETSKVEYFKLHKAQLMSCQSRVHPPYHIHEIVSQVVGGAWTIVEQRLESNAEGQHPAVLPALQDGRCPWRMYNTR